MAKVAFLLEFFAFLYNFACFFTQILVFFHTSIFSDVNFLYYFPGLMFFQSYNFNFFFDSVHGSQIPGIFWHAEDHS